MKEVKNAEVRRNGEDRASIEAERGISRNESGEIVLTKEQKIEKIAYFKAKIEDFANRTKNAKATIKNLESSLEKN